MSTLENVLLYNFEDNSLSLYLKCNKKLIIIEPHILKDTFFILFEQGSCSFVVNSTVLHRKMLLYVVHFTRQCLYLCHLCGQVSSLANLGLLLGFEGWKMIMTANSESIVFSGKDKCRESNCFSANFCPKG